MTDDKKNANKFMKERKRSYRKAKDPGFGTKSDIIRFPRNKKVTGTNLTRSQERLG